MKTLQRLWELAKQEAEEGSDWWTTFGDGAGLFLQPELRTWDYRNTPINTLTFAATGGDGVHYGLLKINGEVTEQSPVVMTVPMKFNGGNLIVGENLHEFLRLGFHSGYFSLEQLVYDWARGVDLLRGEGIWRNAVGDPMAGKFASPYSNERTQYLLTVLRKGFALRPLENPESRIRELNEQFLPLLEFAPAPDSTQSNVQGTT